MRLSGSNENRRFRGSWLFAAYLFVSFPLLSQSQTTIGEISGTVTGPNGSILAGAHVVLSTTSSSADQKQTETDRKGRYSFTGLPTGAYKVTASATGFLGSGVRIVFLTSSTATADLTLSPLQTGQVESRTGNPVPGSPPAFTAAGVRGTIAPSGYASGLSSEETFQVQATANALEATFFSRLIDGARVDCNQESILLHKLENAPDEFAANHALGDFYLGHGDYSKAILYLDAARSLVPSDFTNSRDLAMALIGAGRGSDAASLLERVLLDGGPGSTLFKLLGYAYWSGGQNEKSIAAFLKAAAIDPGIENQYESGLGLIQLGALKEALDLFSVATKTHPESARSWLGLGIAEHLLFHKQEAVTALLRSAEGDADFFPPLALLAELSGLPDETQADLLRRIAGYLTAHPKDAEAHFAYALVLSKQAPPAAGGNSRQEVTIHLKRAVGLNPKMARAHFLLGAMEAEANNSPGAIKEFVEVVRLEPGNARAHYRLSLLYHRNGQQEDARREMDTYRAIHDKRGGEDLADGNVTHSIGMSLFETVSGQRGCGLKTE